MEYLWIPISLFAVVVQTTRNVLLKRLRNDLSDKSIVLSRFACSLPFSLVILGALKVSGYKLPEFNIEFMLYVIAASLLQVAGGFLFLALFGRRNFVIGITYSKTETIQAALFGAVVFAEFISIGAGLAIMIGFAGIILISVGEKHIEPKNLISRMFTKSAAIGLSCGVLFGMTVVLIRQSVLALEGGEFFVKAAYALVFMFLIEVMIATIIALPSFKQEVVGILKAKKKILTVGFINTISSLSWFISFSLANAAYVSMVGQLEILLSAFLTHKLFKENIDKMEKVGIFLILASIVMLLYFG